ncbi:GTPase-associated protein 1-related protein [Actinoplanes sp. HUAS TT8]|uniref:GTPase-associated protein 1-related protein n=1 Tax=Actinoplanes sp. HUAS TT8 TaxID=3447453 RepID=UPI003F525B83
MGVPQMYYTSCESGLAGYPGFQFNAATPGVPGAVLRRVEQATSYEPPRSLGYEPTAEQLAATPVNLCYQPGGDGEPAILANTVFVGNDYSQRFGNYFVHALSLDADDLAVVRPIDFWGAAFWARTEAARVELPELDAVPSPAFDSESFLRAGREGMTPRLLTAVERAIVTGDRPVIVVTERTDEVAGWIAALCELLPPAMIARFAFATYQYRPGRGREHLVGTVPTSDFVVTESALRSFAVFDLAGGAASGGDEHPLAALLTVVGVGDARLVWELAGELAAGTEHDFDAWYPVVVAAALRIRLPVDDGDLAAVLAWLPGNADRLPPETIAQITEECLDHEALTLPQCLVLVGVAARAQDPDLHANTEVSAFERLLRDPAGAPADVPRVSTRAGRRYARQQVTTRLDGAAPGPDTVAVLSLAVRTRVDLSEEELAGYGRDLITPLLLEDPPHRPPSVLGSVPALRRGVLRGLDEALSTRERGVLAAAVRLAGGPVPEEEFAAHPRLQRLIEVSRAAGDPRRRIPALKRLSGSAPPDRAVVTALWPHGWELAEAAEVAREVPDGFWASEAMLGLLDDALARNEVSSGGMPHFIALTTFVARAKLTDRLSAAARSRVADMQAAVKLVQRAEKTADGKLPTVAGEFIGALAAIEPPARLWLAAQLPAVLLRLDGAALTDLLLKVPSEIRRRYRERVADELNRSADLGLAAHTFEAFHLFTGVQPDHARKLDETLTASVARWKSRDLDALEKLLAHSKIDGLAEHLTEWRETRVPRGLGRFLPRRR